MSRVVSSGLSSVRSHYNNMKNTLFTILAIVFQLVVAGAFVDTKSVDAQQNCTVSQIEFTAHKTPGSDFYQEADPPFFYFDINTADCIGETLSFSLYQEDTGNFFEVDAFDHRTVLVGTGTFGEDDFTLAGIAGEENCAVPQNPDCQYRFNVENSNGAIIYTTPGTITYDCEGFTANLLRCTDGPDWQYLGVIPFGNDFGGPNGVDQYGPGQTTGNTVTPPPPTPGDTVDGPSTIPIEIPNPLAGTIDTLPSFFQKVVEFIIKIGVPLVAMAIVYSGFLFVSARGSDDQLKKAKDAFTYSIIGGLILLAAWLVADAIKDALLSL